MRSFSASMWYDGKNEIGKHLWRSSRVLFHLWELWIDSGRVAIIAFLYECGEAASNVTTRYNVTNPGPKPEARKNCARLVLYLRVCGKSFLFPLAFRQGTPSGTCNFFETRKLRPAYNVTIRIHCFSFCICFNSSDQATAFARSFFMAKAPAVCLRFG